MLVIDDEPLLLRSIQRMLKQYDVTLALGGQDAITLLSRDQDFCVILCDLSMPDVDGMHVYEFLSHHAPSLLPRTVFMSGSPVAFDWFGSPGPRTLNKPFELHSLRRIIETSCSHKHA